ncbi:hypothetical protein ACFSHT_16025 [Paraburkholderia silviterrae]|uniref:Lipoprotein n=1 Tax=Paraburkholderia silviterrae TaxID=2528715 RepID=A0A4R5M9A1_9BURK|nr:hypothetical protein [Paraburkholderia silviterrae]TDG23202.1 hypothetical protein EYW47_14810 [Paraburkholderia silviterrae]
MKKRMLLAAGLAASVAFAGCATTTGTSTTSTSATPVLTLPQLTMSPAQLAGAFCPAFDNAITLITTFNATAGATLPFAANANTVIKSTVQPLVNGVCAGGATITTTNVQALIQQGIPAVAGIVAAMPLPPATQAAIQAGFAVAELATNLVNQFENAVASAKASAAVPASGASAASAPAAASTPLTGAPLQ